MSHHKTGSVGERTIKVRIFTWKLPSVGETMTITIVKAALNEDLQMMLEHAKYMEDLVKTNGEMSLEIL